MFNSDVTREILNLVVGIDFFCLDFDFHIAQMGLNKNSEGGGEGGRENLSRNSKNGGEGKWKRMRGRRRLIMVIRRVISVICIWHI